MGQDLFHRNIPVVRVAVVSPEDEVRQDMRIDAWIPDCEWVKVQKDLGRTQHECVLHAGLTLTVYVNREYFDPDQPDITSLRVSAWPDAIDLEQLNSAAHPIKTLRVEFTTDDGIRVQCELHRESWELIKYGLERMRRDKELAALPPDYLEQALG